MNKSRFIVFLLPIILLTFFITLSGWQSGPTISKSDQDTTKKSRKIAGYNRKTIITFDENGKPHEQIFEEFEGDEGLQRLTSPDNDFDFVMPEMPDFEGFAMPSFPKNFPFNMMRDFELDSLDEFRLRFGDRDFESFGEEMEAMMHDKFESLGPQFQESMKQLEDQLRNMDRSLNLQLDGMNKNLEEQLSHMNRDLSDIDFDLQGLDENLQNLDEDLEYMNEGIQAFEKDAQQELIKDGYLKQGEKIESIEWTDDNIKFNNIEIKPEHLRKYRELKEKHVKHQWHKGRPE